jgi:hypothetical protein
MRVFCVPWVMLDPDQAKSDLFWREGGRACGEECQEDVVSWRRSWQKSAAEEADREGGGYEVKLRPFELEVARGLLQHRLENLRAFRDTHLLLLVGRRLGQHIWPPSLKVFVEETEEGLACCKASPQQ